MTVPPRVDAASARRQLAMFLASLYAAEDIIEVRRLPSLRSTWHSAADVDGAFDACLESNRARQNIYIGANPRLDFGRRGNAGVKLARSVWVDFDDEHLTTTTPDERVAEVRQRIRDSGLPDPSMVLVSGHGVHCYWLLAVPVTDFEAWDVVMDALVTRLGSCTGAKGLERIMRAPGFVNWKPPVAVAELIECHPVRRYDWDDIACVVIHANTPEPPEVRHVEEAIAAHRGSAHGTDRTSVIDAFNDRFSITEVLDAAGYDLVGKWFRRPGKRGGGFSGIVRLNKAGRPVSAHWSSNDPLNDQRFGGQTCGIHDSFSAYTLLEHGGNVVAAVRAAAALLNIPLPRQKADATVLEEIAAGGDCEVFGELFFTDPQTADTRTAMRAIVAKYTTNPLQVTRIVSMPACSEAVTP